MPTALSFVDANGSLRMLLNGQLSDLDTKQGLRTTPISALTGQLAGESGSLGRDDGVILVIDGSQRVAGLTLDRFGKLSEVFRVFVPGNLHRLAFAATCKKGSRMVTLHEATDPNAASALKFWDLSGPEATLRHEIRTPHRSATVGLAMTPDGSLAVTAAADGSIKLWRLPK